jgi:hypothetical protein
MIRSGCTWYNCHHGEGLARYGFLESWSWRMVNDCAYTDCWAMMI